MDDRCRVLATLPVRRGLYLLLAVGSDSGNAKLGIF